MTRNRVTTERPFSEKVKSLVRHLASLFSEIYSDYLHSLEHGIIILGKF